MKSLCSGEHLGLVLAETPIIVGTASAVAGAATTRDRREAYSERGGELSHRVHRLLVKKENGLS
jgi:hypothetical protein